MLSPLWTQRSRSVHGQSTIHTLHSSTNPGCLARSQRGPITTGTRSFNDRYVVNYIPALTTLGKVLTVHPCQLRTFERVGGGSLVFLCLLSRYRWINTVGTLVVYMRPNLSYYPLLSHLRILSRLFDIVNLWTGHAAYLPWSLPIVTSMALVYHKGNILLFYLPS